MTQRVGIIVGHSPARPGAKLYDGQWEWGFNLGVAAIAQQALGGALNGRIKIFYRQPGPYHASMLKLAGEVISWSPAWCLELHLNALNGRTAVRGSEILVMPGVCDRGSMGGRRAFRMSELLLEKYGIWPRGKCGVREIFEGQRGYWNLAYLQRGGVPSMLVEPCFADVEHEDSKKIVEYPEKYGRLIAQLISEFS